MANNLVLGARKAVDPNHGLSAQEVEKYTHRDTIRLVEGDKIVCLSSLPFVEIPLFADKSMTVRAKGKDGEELRAIEAVCLILHADGSFEAALISLNFLAGKDIYKTDTVSVAKSKKGNLYYAYHTLDRVHSVAPMLPIALGCTKFTYDLTLECKGEVTGYKELPLSESFVEEKGGFVNCDIIKARFDNHEDAKLPATSRPMLVKAAESVKVTATQQRALETFLSNVLAR